MIIFSNITAGKLLPFFLFFCSVGTNYNLSRLENTMLNLSHDIFGGPGEVTDIRVE